MPRRRRHGVEEVGVGYLMVKLEGRSEMRDQVRIGGITAVRLESMGHGNWGIYQHGGTEQGDG